MAFICDGHRKGGKVLVKDGFRYLRNKVTKTTIYWRCWKPICGSLLQTNVFDVRSDNPNINIWRETDHNHESDDDMIEYARFVMELKKEIRRNPSTTIKRIYDAGLIKKVRRGDSREFIPDFLKIRPILARARRQILPSIPKTTTDVVIEGQWTKTWSNYDFLLDHDVDWGVTLFGTAENIRRLQKCKDVYMDGTFRTCPNPYTQVFTIHGNYRNRVLPFVMGLMVGRTVGHYRHVLGVVKAAVRRESGHRWRPRKVISDFEPALTNAIETELPNAELSGCYFHFTQSLWSKIQELGLATRYRRHIRLRKCLRKFMAIGYLPVTLVRANFQTLATAPRTLRLIRRCPELQDFITYMENNYFEGSFPPALWNVHQRDMDNRTNNHVEG
ncbi:hypothetical protein SNE40_001068 [Patella caerulea]|uniref:MULE transposase domain-containing protein n=1 Tax=Patella caerulea TaxID=87958 RepID=A0AAN8KGK3_PATCE